jgi:hypothetical protein
MGEIWLIRRVGFRESMLMALAIYAVARAGETQAADAAPKFDLPRSVLAAPLFAHPLLSPSFAVAPTQLTAEPLFPNEFRPRSNGFLDVGGGRDAMRMTDMPRFQDTSVERQMAQFKSQDRLRLLTLWQSHASSLSIQAGKRGSPSLQWSTPLMRRDAGSRGLFDRLLSVSPQGAFGGSRNTVPRQAAALAPSKSLELSSALKPQ